MKGILAKAALAFLFASAVALLAFNLRRVPPGLADFSSPAAPAAGGSKIDRPADVGNAAGEAFLRKLERPAAVPASGPIRVKDETFSAAYDELYDHRDAYYGRGIELSGYVMAQEELGSGGFLVGRDLLWCCEDDKYFIGFLVFSDGPAPAAGSSVAVRGVLEAAEYRNPENGKTFTVPAIRASYVGPAEGLFKTVYPN